ncbi:DUF262 domain-containing HNH endonuclease family protein [Kingella kingae]|uniref:DUF262 domain-containing protein n=1 Tax=Kingella kingae TaxID=504 RepID=UPI00254A5CCC|nr:DUF262 domain-containing HNH endonuclease family protein [Kingella kingae]MDK4597556.1 DUF262 domain-containing HNH endonuclease family protein [Kingella kingae]MDK4601498.1 DUF262 domain-containing HNH endonuclease family protein [Kingella kingae]MDK4655200.1 DUF262 domain-containing HNH endonuclease family protein [Kingella kingae]
MSQELTLSIFQLLHQDRYIIPIYQRNYAWTDKEISPLLSDMYQAFQRQSEHYYIGSLVVYRRENALLEVIDGQQRLTTFTLLAHQLRNQFSGSLNLADKPNISFEHRQDFAAHLHQPNQLPEHFQAALKAIKQNWLPEYSVKFAQFILDNVYIIRTEMPPKTDLNHYFEIMNTCGEQLEKHEILKARLLSRLNDCHATSRTQEAFSQIWDACSDMNRYMVLGFKPAARKAIFGNNYQEFQLNSDSIKQAFSAKESDVSTTILQLIENKFEASQSDGKDEQQETSERFHSVIDFPNFLMHVLRIFVEKETGDVENAKNIVLDERKLLETIKVEEWDKKKICQFAKTLCQCRYLFDRYVIKTDSNKDDHWSLLTIKSYNKSSYQFDNTFSIQNEQNSIVMLLAMFHVSLPSLVYKNWLYAVLRWLYFRSAEPTVADYQRFLEDLSDRYYFGYYGNDKKVAFFDLITQENFRLPEHLTYPKIFKETGIQIPNFIFNRLDYLLWKNEKYNQYKDKFRFAFRTSVEHFYPQNPDEQHQRLSDNVLHSFGNLCLLPSNINSKFTNNLPAAKKANFSNMDNPSFKLMLMFELADKWNEDIIKQHENEMLAVLNQRFQAA